MAPVTFPYLDLLPEEVRQMIYELALAAETDFASSPLLTALKDHPVLYNGAMEAHNRVSATISVGNEAEFIKLPYARRSKILNLKLILHRMKERPNIQCPLLARSSIKLMNNIETLSLHFATSEKPMWNLPGQLICASSNPRRLVARLPAPLKPANRIGFHTYWMSMENICLGAPHHDHRQWHPRDDWIQKNITNRITQNNAMITRVMQPQAGEAVPAASHNLFLPREVQMDHEGLSLEDFSLRIDEINSKFVGVSGKLLRVSPLQYPEEWLWEDPTGKRLQLAPGGGFW